eukprot:COSAG06_NODE_9357_length_1919_cov_1.982437_1_plen_23_part_10
MWYSIVMGYSSYHVRVVAGSGQV